MSEGRFVEAVPCRFPWHDAWQRTNRCPHCRGIGWEVVRDPQVVRLQIDAALGGEQ